MKRNLRIFCIIAAIIIQNGFAQAQELTLTVEQARQYALDHNRSLKNASLEVKKAESDRWQTISTMLPQVSANFDYQNYCGYSAQLSGFNIAMNPNGTFGITSSMSLSGVQIVGSMLKTIAIEMSQISEQKNDLTIKNQITTIYMSVLALEKTITLLDSNYANLMRLQQMTENAFKAGANEQTDVDQIKVQTALIRNNINATKRQLETLYNSMRLLLGCQTNTKLTLANNIDQLLSIAAAEQLLNATFNINQNYDYRLLEKNVELADRQVWLAAVEYFPSIRLFHQYSYKTYFGKDAGFNMTPPNLVGIGLAIPIWSSGTRATKVRSALISKEIAENNIALVSDQLATQNSQLRYNLISAMENYAIQTENINVSQRVFESYSRKYKYGTASSIDLTNANNNLISAQNNYIQSMLNLLNTQIELENLLNNK